MVRLWAHEVLRVFSDRLISVDDRNVCFDIVKDASGKCLLGVKDAGDLDTCMAHCSAVNSAVNGASSLNASLNAAGMNNLLFCDFLRPEMDPKPYDEIDSIVQLRQSMQMQLDEYNLVSTKPMHLVLFNYAIQHVSRISRVLRTPGGHALLVGVGGSGRQSLTYMAGYMGGFQLKQIRITSNYGMTDFHDDLREAMMCAAGMSEKEGEGGGGGGDGKGSGASSSSNVGGCPTIFLLSDTQIQEETMVENISNLLNSGEVPNMLTQEDIANAIEQVRPAAKLDRAYQKRLQLAAGTSAKVEPSPGQLYQYWKVRVRANLHVVLAFSPVGVSFRTRLRQFPSIINCCTIDSFSEWPSEALAATAESLLSVSSPQSSSAVSSEGSEGSEGKEGTNQPPALSANAVKEQLKMQGAGLPKGSAVLAQVVDMCMYMHESTKACANTFYNDLKRHYHVTPTSYLEMLQTFKDLLGSKKLQVLESKFMLLF